MSDLQNASVKFDLDAAEKRTGGYYASGLLADLHAVIAYARELEAENARLASSVSKVRVDVELPLLWQWLTNNTPSCLSAGCVFTPFHPDERRGHGMQVGMCRCWDVHKEPLNLFLQGITSVVMDLMKHIRRADHENARLVAIESKLLEDVTHYSEQLKYTQMKLEQLQSPNA